MADYYNLLGVPPAATADEIRAAFRKLAKRVHPDAHATGSPRQREEAERRFIQLAQAYETLSHAGLRRRYDERRKADAASAAASSARPGPKAAAGGSAAAQEAPPRPTAERQQRADQARRPSPDGERQDRADRTRRATERDAEARQRRAEAERRERERAQREAHASAQARRRTQTQAEQARARTYGRVRPERPVEGLVEDIEALLARFGLDLRTPAEVVWDTLLTWARRLFRDTAPPEERPRKPKVEPHRQTATPPKPPPRRRKPSIRDEAEDAVFRELRDEPSVDRRAEDLELERDLADLKRGLRDGAATRDAAAQEPPKPKRAAEDDELRELKRKLGKE